MHQPMTALAISEIDLLPSLLVLYKVGLKWIMRSSLESREWQASYWVKMFVSHKERL